MSLDYGEILKKAFNITKNNRSLWVFGFLLALFGGGGFNFPSFNYDFPSSGSSGKEAFPKVFNNIDPSNLLTIILIIVLALFVLWLLVIFIHSLANGALVDMVNDIDNGGTVTVKDGFKAGFGYALPLILIAIVIWVPSVIAMIVLGGVLVGPGIMLFMAESKILGLILGILGGGLFLILIVALVVSLGIIHVYSNRFYVIEEDRVVASIKRGYSLYRQNIGSSLLLWLINVGIGFGQGIVVLLIALVLFLVIGLILGLPIVLLAMSINNWIYGFLAIPIVLFLVAITFVGGLFESFFSAYWTLAFKDLTATPDTNSA